MIVKPLDLAMIQQSNQVSQIKQQQVARPMVEQANIAVQVEKKVEARSEQVKSKENAENKNSEKQFDAKEKSNNEYDRNGLLKNNKKKDKDGKVTLKNENSVDFDVKI